MEQLVFVLILGIIAFIQWAMKKSAEERKDARTGGNAQSPYRPVGPRPIDPFPRPDDAARKLREALGLPAGVHVPEPVRRTPRPLPPQVPDSPPPASPLIEAAEKLAASARLASQQQAKPARKKAPVSKSAAAHKTPAAPRNRLEELLHSSDGLRSAILAREVLGPPKGLEF
jgi:hypothetical protein